MNHNPFGSDEPASGTLSADEQAEYDRLEALEQEPDERPERDADLREAFPLDEAAEERFPVEHGAIVDSEDKRTYDTPWGRREMDEDEVSDLRHQGVTCTPVDSAPETSLQDEKNAMSSVKFSSEPSQS